MELTLQDYSFLGHSASVTAASALKIALYFLDGIQWSKVSDAFDHEAGDLEACCQAIYGMLRGHVESPLPAVKEKYSHSKCLRVSEYTFEELILEEDSVDGRRMEVDV